ncbi:MAG: sialate O-acetylesterase [Bacteroides sp.]|nr:sialate O-acetylesterase [Bacteroides sp.]
MKKYILLSLLYALLGAEALSAKVELPAIFGDHMILQQKDRVRLWGKALPNRMISIHPSWDQEPVQVRSDRSGRWVVMLSTPAAGGPYTMRISDGEELLLENILIGEVWFCAGQSNMEMPMKGFRGQPVAGTLPDIVKAKEQRPIRLFRVEQDHRTTPSEELSGCWQTLRPEHVAGFSAVAYYYGDLLQEVLDVPVGLIQCAWSASKIETWMDRETLTGFPEVELPALEQKEFGWIAGTPTLLWNAMVCPWRGFPVKGVIWYQGEANAETPELYRKLFPALVEQWRDFFASLELPFYYVQLPPFAAGEPDGLSRAWFRQMQLELSQEIPFTALATTADVGDSLYIHPPRKKEIGQRLALLALTDTYARKGFLSHAPVCREYQLKGQVVELMFDPAGEGLIPEHTALAGFEIAGPDGGFRPAEAEIIHGSARVRVWHPEVRFPAEIRYGFRNFTTATLFSNAGIPASPFRIEITDDTQKP